MCTLPPLVLSFFLCECPPPINCDPIYYLWSSPLLYFPVVAFSHSTHVCVFVFDSSPSFFLIRDLFLLYRYELMKLPCTLTFKKHKKIYSWTAGDFPLQLKPANKPVRNLQCQELIEWAKEHVTTYMYTNNVKKGEIITWQTVLCLVYSMYGHLMTYRMWKSIANTCRPSYIAEVHLRHSV